jgi:voltage-gated potassium channel
MFWLSLVFLGLLAGTVFSRQLAERLAAHRQKVAAAAAATVPKDGSAASKPAVGTDEQPPEEKVGSRDELSVDGLTQEDLEQALEEFHIPPTRYCVYGVWLLWPIFWLEWLLHWWTGGRFAASRLWYCIFPPLRMGGRDHVEGGSIWLPRVGWQRVGRHLSHRLERVFSGPMILMALAVLPLLGVEIYGRRILGPLNWQLIVVLIIGEMIIWLAFALEFIIMVSVVPKPIRYCREHWIDIAIICLPLIAFLRILRLGRLLRLHHVTRVARVYRLRGLSMRMFRGVLLLDVMSRFIQGDTEKKLNRLREDLALREVEMEELKAEICRLEAELADEIQEEAGTSVGDIPS